MKILGKREIALAAVLAALFLTSKPIELTPDQLSRLREGRLWSKENRVAFAARDLDEFTHTSAFRRALYLDHPPNSARKKLPKRTQRKRRSRSK